ncbi:MAG: DUF2934 domain-containing protein [Rhodocyclaceae bacterium]|nr:DUF2934 domain-containing protein [Rhodocyclaceae bacterium]
MGSAAKQQVMTEQNVVQEAVASAGMEACGDEMGCDPRTEAIRMAAYMKAEARGFEGGHELDDWLAAEMEFEQLAGK